MPPLKSCLNRGHPSPEVTDAICRVPSTSFSQAPWYALPAYLCWFRVRSYWQGYFLEHLHCLYQSNKKRQYTVFVTTARSRNINRVPIYYGFRPRLRGRLTLLRLALSRNPWAFGDSVSHTVYRYSCQHSHFRYLHLPSRYRLHRLTERFATTQLTLHPQLRYMALAPLHLRRRPAYLDQ